MIDNGAQDRIERDLSELPTVGNSSLRIVRASVGASVVPVRYQANGLFVTRYRHLGILLRKSDRSFTDSAAAPALGTAENLFYHDRMHHLSSLSILHESTISLEHPHANTKDQVQIF